ncbi:11330_t:CDS:1, partial [Funneliformis mosseae]
RRKPAKLKAHLINECLQCLEDINKFWRIKFASEKTAYTHSPKVSTFQLSLKQQTIMEHFGSDKELPFAITKQIDRFLLKA